MYRGLGADLVTPYEYDPGTVSGQTVAADPSQAIDFGTPGNPMVIYVPTPASATAWLNANAKTVAIVAGVGVLALILMKASR